MHQQLHPGKAARTVCLRDGVEAKGCLPRHGSGRVGSGLPCRKPFVPTTTTRSTGHQASDAPPSFSALKVAGNDGKQEIKLTTGLHRAPLSGGVKVATTRSVQTAAGARAWPRPSPLLLLSLQAAIAVCLLSVAQGHALLRRCPHTFCKKHTLLHTLLLPCLQA